MYPKQPAPCDRWFRIAPLVWYITSFSLFGLKFFFWGRKKQPKKGKICDIWARMTQKFGNQNSSSFCWWPNGYVSEKITEKLRCADTDYLPTVAGLGATPQQYNHRIPYIYNTSLAWYISATCDILDWSTYFFGGQEQRGNIEAHSIGRKHIVYRLTCQVSTRQNLVPLLKV